jgi:hypothetical protein
MTGKTLHPHYLAAHRKQCPPLTLLILVLLPATLCLAPLHHCFAFPIANSPSVAETSTSAAFDGTNYLVGFQEKVGTTRPISARFLSQSGTLVGEKVTLDLEGGPPRVAFDGANYFLVTEENNNPSTYIYGQFLSGAGTKIGGPVNVTTGGTNIAGPVIIFDGTNYFVVWNDNSTLYGQFVSPSGTLVGSPITLCAGTAPDYDVPQVYNAVPGATNILVAWADGRRGAICGPAICELDIYGQLVGKSGAGTPGALEGGNFATSENDDWSDMSFIGIAFDGNNYLVAWNDMTPQSHNARLYAQLVSPTGTLVGGVIDSGTPTTNKHRDVPFLAFDGANYLLTWSNTASDFDHDNVCDPNEGNCLEAYGQFISPSGRLQGAPFLVAGGPLHQLAYPVFGESQYLFVINTFKSFEGNKANVSGKFMYPQPLITYPNGGELVTAGTSVAITWNWTDPYKPIKTVKLSYSKDKGVSWIPIAAIAGPQNTGTYTWNVPPVKAPKTKCLVKIVFMDAGGKIIGSDKSDAVFTIQPSGGSIQR